VKEGVVSGLVYKNRRGCRRIIHTNFNILRYTTRGVDNSRPDIIGRKIVHPYNIG
jgi:hypothetical protein